MDSLSSLVFMTSTWVSLVDSRAEVSLNSRRKRKETQVTDTAKAVFTRWEKQEVFCSRTVRTGGLKSYRHCIYSCVSLYFPLKLLFRERRVKQTDVIVREKRDHETDKTEEETHRHLCHHHLFPFLVVWSLYLWFLKMSWIFFQTDVHHLSYFTAVFFPQ